MKLGLLAVKSICNAVAIVVIKGVVVFTIIGYRIFDTQSCIKGKLALLKPFCTGYIHLISNYSYNYPGPIMARHYPKKQIYY